MPRIPLKSDPFAFDDTLPPYMDHPFPGGCWMTCPDAEQAFLARLRFTLKAPAKLRFHVTGDLWFDLRLDGRFLTDGPEWSDSAHWCYASFEEELPAGDHTFLARVVTLPPPLKPWYAMGDNRGFLLIAEAPFAELSTGVGAWEFAPAQSITFPVEYGDAIYRRAVGIPSVLDVTLAEEEPAWNAGTRSGGVFSALTARHFSSRPCLLPARLPEQLRREIPFQLKPVTVPPGETYETVIDLGTTIVSRRKSVSPEPGKFASARRKRCTKMSPTRTAGTKSWPATRRRGSSAIGITTPGASAGNPAPCSTHSSAAAVS